MDCDHDGRNIFQPIVKGGQIPQRRIPHRIEENAIEQKSAP
jgi:hypothetical protein